MAKMGWTALFFMHRAAGGISLLAACGKGYVGQRLCQEMEGNDG